MLRSPAIVLLLASWLAPPVQAETVVCLGDSITAGYGLAVEQAWPALLQETFAANPATARWKVVNAGVSGDTSASGLRRVRWVLKQKPEWLFIALGGNDGLRGLPVDALERNLRAIAAEARTAGARVAIAGMRMPANLGEDYRTAFAEVFPRVAGDLRAPLLPFLLDGVAMDPKLNQPDQIHPNAEGQKAIARTVAAFLNPLLTVPGTAP